MSYNFDFQIHQELSKPELKPSTSRNQSPDRGPDNVVSAFIVITFYTNRKKRKKKMLQLKQRLFLKF